MTYTLPGTSIQLLRPDGTGFAAPFETEWYCEPCALSHRRYRVLHETGWIEHAWHEVLLPDDDARTCRAKLAHAKAVIDAEDAILAAENAYRRLTGRSFRR